MRPRPTVSSLPVFVTLLLALVMPWGSVSAQARDTAGDTVAAAKTDSVPATVHRGAPVVVAGDTLFRIVGTQGPFSAQDRAAAVVDRLRRAARSARAATDSGAPVSVVRQDGALEITAGGVTLLTVTPEDAAARGTTPELLADSLAAVLGPAIRAESHAATFRVVLTGLLLTALTTVALLGLLWVFSRLFRALYVRFRLWAGTRIPAVRIQRLRLASARQVAEGLVLAARALRIALTLVLLYAYVTLVLSYFPWTRGLSSRVVHYVTEPLAVVGTAVLDYLPNVFFILIIGLVTWYALKLVRLVFTGLERERLSVPGFYPDWATPTFKIVRVLILAFAVVMMWPYLPRSDSAAFRGVAAFLGLLLTFGSAGAISNIIGGIVLVYMRPFQAGDRVRISDTEGDVVEKTLLVTRVRTPKNVVITIPNAQVLASHIVNFSSTRMEDQPLILHTAVSIGYGVPWRQVHELLLTAAKETEGVLETPPPFVLQTVLGDFYVTYELNAHTSHPRLMARIYSDLHRNIQDAFASAGVEILSPHYRAERDGNPSTVPSSAYFTSTSSS